MNLPNSTTTPSSGVRGTDAPSSRRLPKSRSTLPLQFKLFVWSVILEPLLFFVVGSRTVTGVTANVSRILQFAIVLGVLYAAMGSGFARRRIHPFNRYYVCYTAYLFAACVSGVYGLLSGTYDVPLAYAAGASDFAAELNSTWVRPFFEYCIAFYYFVYFAVLPQFFLTNERRIAYFFKAFFVMFNTTLVLGFLDVLLAPTGIVLLGRHLGDWISVGGRFHGLAGEPRDAFVYLILGISVAFLRGYVTGKRPGRVWIGSVLFAAVLTQSASGLLGIGIFLLLLAGRGVLTLNRPTLIAAIITPMIIAPLLYVVVENTERLKAYQDVLLVIWDILERHEDIPPIVQGQLNNIYPAYNMISRVRELDLVPLLIGFGFGSASAINNVMGTFDELANPNSQLIRLIYESGLIGSVLFVLAFYKPMDVLTERMAGKDRRKFLLLTLLLLGAFLGHRNASLYIFLGICLATLRPRPAYGRVVTAPATPAPYSLAPAAPR